MAEVFKNLRYQQVELLYRSTRFAIIATVIGAAILANVMWPFIDHTLISVWLAAMLLIAGVRGALSYRFFNCPREEIVVPLWAKYYSVSSAFAAAGWGIATIILFPEGHFAHQAFLAFIVAGLAAGATTSLAAIFSVAVIFLTLVLIPLGITLLITADTLLMTMGVLTLVFYGFLLGSARRISNNIIAMIHAREKAEEREKDLSRFKTTLDMTMDCIFMFDPISLKFIYVNEGALSQVGYSYEEMMCMRAVDIKPEYTLDEFRQFVNPMTLGEKNVVNFETVHEHKNGSLIPVEIFLQYINPPEEFPRFVAIVRDVTKRNELMQELTSYANAVGLLHDISANQRLTLKEKIENVLNLGLGVFGLSIGIVSEIKDKEYRVEYIQGPDDIFPAGTMFSLNETYCVHTYVANSPTSFHSVGKSEIKNHPCYKKFKFETYLGSPVYVDGKRHGTLNFSSPEGRAKPFSRNDHLLVQLFAEWVGNEFSRQSKDARIHSIFDNFADGIVTTSNEGIIETVNPEAVKIFGYSGRELIGRNVSILMGEPYYTEHNKYLARHSESGLVKSIGASQEIDGRRRNGDLFPLEISVSDMHIGDHRMFTGILRDISDRKKTEAELKAAHARLMLANERLEILSLEDGLTGISNRRHFDFTLSKEYRVAMRNNDSIAILLCDIDHFKQYNDTYGHGAGDECLARVAQCLNSIPRRPNDVVARYGGEEFAIILPSTDVKGAVVVAENIRQAVWDLNIMHQSSHTADRVTISLGVASVDPEREDLEKEFLKQVDKALYHAKARGRNQVQTFC